MTPTSESRLYALDNLRAIMMWLGIVLHVAAIHMVAPSPIPWRDEQRTPLADALTAFIHAFRMPVFFILAGFLAALLIERRGARAFVRHRVLRLALPFALFWPPLWIATGLAALAFLNRMAFGHWGLDESVLPAWVPRGPATMHLWFLWLLFWLCMATAVLVALPRQPFRLAGALLARLGRASWGFALLALPLVVAGAAYPRGLLVANGSFLPPWNEWLHNGLFFAFGLALYAHREGLLDHYAKRWSRYAWAGLFFFFVTGALDRLRGPEAAFSFSYNACSWLWSFAWIGLALRVLERRHAVLAYLADSAYWVYLVHMPLTVAFGALLFGLPLPALVKIALNIAATTLVCLVSYRLAVRHTWVSLLLNGKRHPLPPRGGASGLRPAARARR